MEVGRLCHLCQYPITCQTMYNRPTMFGLFSFLFLTINLPKIPILPDIPTVNIERPKITSSAVSYSDSAFQNQTTNFSPGQTVYVLVKTTINADYTNLNLLDSDKNIINSFKLSKIENGFTISFSTPDKSGIYYLDIEIKSGENNVFKSQSNINVGETGGNIISIVDSNVNVVNLPTLKPILTLKPTKKIIPNPTLHLKSIMEESSSFYVLFWERLKSFFVFLKPIGH